MVSDLNKKKKLIKVEYPKKPYYFTYDFLTDSKEGQNYLKVIYSNKYPIWCTCKGIGKEIPLYISNYSNHYVLKTYKDNPHASFCPRYSSVDIKSPPKSNNIEPTTIAIVEKDGLQAATFNSRGFIDKKPTSNSKSTHVGTHTYTKNEYSQLFTIGELLITMAWDNFITLKKQIPKEGNLFYQIFNDLYNTCKIDPSTKLSEIMYKPSYKFIENTDITNMVQKACYSIYKKGNKDDVKGYNMYVLAKVEDIKELDNDYIELLCNYPLRKDVKITFKVLVKKSYYNGRVSTLKVKDSKKYISAFLYLNNNKLYTKQMALIPVINGIGCYVESSKEIEFANMLIDKRKRFKKPCRSNKSDKWKGYIPDFLIYDEKTKDYTIIAEVFGYYTDNYKKAIEEKINYFSSLDNYKFIYWKANEGQPMPEV